MSRIRIALIGIVAASALLMSVGVAHADNLQAQDLTVAGDFTVQPGEIANVSYRLQVNNGDVGDQQAGCNASDGSTAVVTIIKPAALAIVSPAQPMSFTGCGNANAKTVQFVSNVAGDYDISASVADSGGGGYNTNPAKFTLHVVEPVVEEPEDTTPPVINVPDDITEEATGPSGAAVSFNVTAEDDVDGPNVPVTCNPPSGSTFPLDVWTTVTCTATDSHNNTATKSFKVFVQDTTPPDLNLPSESSVTKYGWNGFFQPIDNGDVVNKARAGQSIPVKFSLTGSAAVTYSVAATDFVDGNVTAFVTCDRPSGSVFPNGITTVNCWVSDAHDNMAFGSFDVNVLGGNQGLAIMALNYPNFVQDSVPPADGTDDVETYASSVPGLNYDPIADQYVYVWKTDKTWAGKSGTLNVKLADGSMHTGRFNFTK
jgi:hypothetical protein